MTPELVFTHPGALRLARSTGSPDDALQAAAVRVLEYRPATWGAWWMCVRGGILNWLRTERRAPTLTTTGDAPDVPTPAPVQHLDTVSDLVDLLTALHPRHQRTAAALIYGDPYTQRELHALRQAARAWAQEQHHDH